MQHRPGNVQMRSNPGGSGHTAAANAARAKLQKAFALYQKGRLAQAEKVFRQVLNLHPKNIDALHMSGVIACQTGRPKQAVELIGRAIENGPGKFTAYNSRGIVLQQLGRFGEALANYDEAIRLRPDYAIAYYNRGNVLFLLERFDEALESYDRALKLKPSYVDAHYNRGRTLHELRRLEEALASYDQAISLKPDHAIAYYNRGNTLYGLKRFYEAHESYDRAVMLKPDYAEAHNNIGYVLRDQGHLEKAIASFGRALQLRPDYAEAHYNLSTSKKFSAGDPQIENIQNLIEKDYVNIKDKIYIRFALGKAYADLFSYEKAFHYISEGNSLRKIELEYDSCSERKHFSDIKEKFSNDRSSTDTEKLEVDLKTIPIFILGMPRSGTSLVEQIVSNHSNVHGAGELDYFTQAISKIDWEKTVLSKDDFRIIRSNYVEKIDNLKGGKLFVTDKMPNNFRWIGFIRRALPEAKIIHIERDPIAVCWSNFKTYFPSPRLRTHNQ